MSEYTKELAEQYKPLTSETRVENFDIPEQIELDGKLVNVPKVFTRKDVHWMITPDGEIKEAAWISQTLAHILNSYRFEDPDIRRSELYKAGQACDQIISRLVKYGVLRDKQGPGAMAFVQANENVPKDAVLISERSFEALCAKNWRWKKAKTVMCVRFPNLGPGTTQKLRVIVNKKWEPRNDSSEYSLGSRAVGLKEFLELYDEETSAEKDQETGVVDAFYLNPETLKGYLEGDGDGDLIYLVIEEYGHPRFEEISLIREPGEIKQSDIEVMFKKADRLDRSNLATWLGPYFDDMPIGPATYKIRWETYLESKRHTKTTHPMAEAWKKVGPRAIQLIEFVMDIRKGEWTDTQIDQKMKSISTTMQEIKKAQQEGNWFAKTVTTQTVQDIPIFINKFKTLQEYVNFITNQPALITE